ncbi:helix-turn-helix domain-containing protein [Micromonospora sp. NPDC048835]|uniref:IclR family transcriptional regulator n=1 Tax=Micromonospora sp. NPDC048835 TaxID=3155147 RepID=UPI0033CE74C5
MLPSQPNKSLQDGLDCLQLLASSAEALGSREVARRLGLEPSRANRLLKTLAHIRLIEQNERRRYRPGPGIHALAAQSLFGSGLIRRALGPLGELHAHGHTVAMGVLWRDQMSYLYHADPGMDTSTALGRIGLFPVARSGLGMALLACQDDESVRAMWATSANETPVEPILTDLAQIREAGFALRPGKTERTVAVTVGATPYAAIGMSGRFPDEHIPDLVGALRHAAEKIEKNG